MKREAIIEGGQEERDNVIVFQHNIIQCLCWRHAWQEGSGSPFNSGLGILAVSSYEKLGESCLLSRKSSRKGSPTYKKATQSILPRDKESFLKLLHSRGKKGNFVDNVFWKIMNPGKSAQVLK